MGSILHIDFETRSDLDLKKVGLHVYARGKNTSVWCMAYAFDDEPVELWEPKQKFPERVYQHIVEDQDVWAHNAAFEIQIWNSKLKPALNTGIPLDIATCTMSMAYAMGLPGSLENCAAALGIPQRKDLEGSRLMLQMSKSRSEDPLVWWDEPEKLERLYKYCKQDVEVERAIGKRMLQLSPYERKVWVLDQRINDRGIHVDTKALKNAIDIVEKEKNRLDLEMRSITNNQVATCTSVTQIRDFLEFYGVATDSIDKANVQELLQKNIDPTAKKVLDLRMEAGKASTAKFGPMLGSAGEDSRVRGCFQYSGANTRRWAGRRIQLHNLKRPTLKHGDIEIILNGLSKNLIDRDFIDIFHGPPLTVLADCTRSFLTAAPGKELIACDYSAIEARVLAWLAGQDNVLEVFRGGLDIYKTAACDIFGKYIQDITDQERQVGKVAVLALGYGGGIGAFQTMAKAYNVKMEPAFHYLWDRANEDQKILTERNYSLNKNREILAKVSKKEIIASDLTKIFWRDKNNQIVQFWYNLEDAAMKAIRNPGSSFSYRHLKFKKSGSFLWCQLPSEGVICYPYPEIHNAPTPWGSSRETITYMSEDGISKKWTRFHTYGGSLAENVTQAVSRDILADAMLRLEDHGYPIVLHVHDEIVCERTKNVGASLEEMKKIMSEVPPWATGLPIAVTGWVGQRYRK